MSSIKSYKQYINGELVSSTSTDVIEVLNPCTEEIIATIPKGSNADAEKALEAAKAAQPAWEALTAAERAGYLNKIAEVIRANRLQLARTLASEQAKVIGLAQVEIDFTATYFDYNAAWARRIEGEIIQSDRKGEQIFLHKCPIGVAVGICPWNFPFFVMARKVAPALVTGNTIVIKPSSIAPNTIMEFTTLLEGVGLPKGVVNFVCGSGSLIGDALVKSPITGIVSLTGSLEAGRQIIAASAEHITKVSLELGGKAPVIVCDDADMDVAIEGVTNSRIIFSGQVCNCAERVYVDRKIYEPFMERLIARFKKVKVGDAFDEDNPEMSSQVSKDQLIKIDGMVKRAKEAGAEILLGGNPNSAFGKGYYYEPTLITGCTQDSEIIQDEIFGPVLPVMPFDSLDEAIANANDCQYGLTSSIFSNNINKVQYGIEKLKFGEVYVNREHFEGMQGFHAGWRKSGIGGADGKHGMEEYLQTKVVYLQRH